MFIKSNPNPAQKRVGDCVIRAISIATGQRWISVYIGLMLKGLALYDMPSSNYVWHSYLSDKGFERNMIPDTCPYCYTVKDFCADHPDGIFILGTGTHVIAVIDGNYYDTWDSGDEIPVFYWG